ncbi:MAG: type II toxin-antitoxin system Phd/YefM family antitoxin [bacterium]
MVIQVVKTISASELKANCSRILDEVERDGIEFVITKRGVPVAKLVPTDERVAELVAEGRR